MTTRRYRARNMAVIAVLLATAAHAETRVTSFTTFMHVGPGTQYAVIDEVPTRTVVDVGVCQEGWCQIRYGAADGWINQRILTPSAPAPDATQPVQCAEFVRTGWPDGGDLERLCLHAPKTTAPAR